MMRSTTHAPLHLDLKDRRILSALDQNARQSCSQIGRKVGLSPEVVHYRVKRLESEGIITQYQCIINLSKLRVLQFKICLLLQHIDSRHLEQILQELKRNSAVKWLVSCRGGWDLLIAVETDTIENMATLKDDILAQFKGFIHRKAVSILVEAHTYTRDYLMGAKHTQNETGERVVMKNDGAVQVDDLDMRILKALSANARRSLTDIASELKATVRVVEYRIRRLQKSGVILGFKIALDYQRLGVKFYKTLVYLDAPSRQRMRMLEQYLAQHRNVIHNVKVVGSWDFEPEFEVTSEEEFNTIITDLGDKFSDILQNIEVITISKEHKFVYF